MAHPIIIDIITLFLGIYLGIQFSSLYIKYSLDKERKKLKKTIESIFKEILDSVSLKKAKFLYRINNTVRFESYIESLGLVTVYFYLNKKEIIIFKDDEAIYTSKDLDIEILTELDYLLRVSFSNEINDTVSVFGTIYSRKYFVDTFKVNSEDMGFNQEDNYPSKVYEDNYDIDSILDKINIVGYDNLSIKEKEYLEKYSANR